MSVIEADSEISKDLKNIDTKVTPGVVVTATVIIWILLVGFSVICLAYGTAPHEKFVELATKIILPLYNSTIVVVLSYVFGKPVVKSVVRRLNR